MCGRFKFSGCEERKHQLLHDNNYYSPQHRTFMYIDFTLTSTDAGAQMSQLDTGNRAYSDHGPIIET